MPCRIAGCENTWTWFAAQQIRGFGQPPPDRMCDEHLGQFNELADREVPCRTPGCPNTWTWKRGAQLAEMQRTGKLRRPSRLCGECFTAERETHDADLPCKIDGCKRTWVWTRDAQLRHRLWVLRQRAKADAAAARNARPRDEQDAGREGSELREGDAPRSRDRDGEAREGEAPRSRGRDGEAREGEAPRARRDGSEAREGEAPRSRRGGREAREGEAPRSRDRQGRREDAPREDAVVAVQDAPREDVVDAVQDAPHTDEAGPREDEAPQDVPRLRERTQPRDEPNGYDVTVERALPFLQPEPVAGSDVAVSEDMSPGAGPEDHVAEDSSETIAAVTTGDAESDSEPGGDRKKRRRKRRRGGKPAPNPEGPPERMCGLCAQKISRIQAKDQPCKVHGCSRTWTWDRASQMRAWVLSGSDDLDFEPAAPKRMCDVCREFCRTHPDREVPCGRPGCESTWTFKTGAQLQAFLAGRTADPLKLCGECSRGEFAATFRPSGETGAVPEGAETMPCVVPGCEGTWLYIPGMRLRDTAYGELAPDRMCDRHREERGFAAASAPEVHEVEVTAADLAVDEAGEDPDRDHDLTIADDPTPEADHHVDDSGEPDAETDAEADTEVSTDASAEVPVDPDPGA